MQGGRGRAMPTREPGTKPNPKSKTNTDKHVLCFWFAMRFRGHSIHLSLVHFHVQRLAQLISALHVPRLAPINSLTRNSPPQGPEGHLQGVGGRENFCILGNCCPKLKLDTLPPNPKPCGWLSYTSFLSLVETRLVWRTKQTTLLKETCSRLSCVLYAFHW